MSISIFDIPLIQDEIAAYLSPHALAQCIPVSTTLHDAFAPFIWRHLHLKNANANAAVTQYTNSIYHAHVRTLTIDRAFYEGQVFSTTTLGGHHHLFHHENIIPSLQLKPWVFHAQFPHLVSLTCQLHPWHAQAATRTMQLLQFIQDHSSLESLWIDKLGSQSIDHRGPLLDLLWTAVGKHPGLRRVDLKIHTPIRPRAFYRILAYCTHFQRLWLGVRIQKDDEPEPAEGDTRTKETLWTRSRRMVEKIHWDRKVFGIRELELTVPNPAVAHGAFFMFLSRCPDLERLSIPMLFGSWIIDLVVDSIRRGLIPRLEKIELGTGSIEVGDQIRLLSTIDSHGLTVLKLYLMSSSLGLVKTIVEHPFHPRTLTELALESGGGIRPRELDSLVMNCSALERLTVCLMVYSDDYVTTITNHKGEKGWTLDDLKPWVCTRLRILSLWIRNKTQPPNNRHILEPLYFQVGRQTCLESLEWYTDEIRNAPKEYHFYEGVYYWGDLKRMQKVSLNNMNSLRLVLRVQEVQWMVRNWPRLDHLTGLLDDSVDERDLGYYPGIEEPETDQAIVWLRDNHPDIHLE